jgi:hypothetical protein
LGEKSNAFSTGDETDLGAALMAGEVKAEDTAKMVVSIAMVVLYMVVAVYVVCGSFVRV